MISDDQRQLRSMVDAIRACLGLRPLYFIGEDLQKQKFLVLEQELPGPIEWKEWFKPKAVTISTRSSFRATSVATALKRKALRFETQQRKRA